MRSRIGASLSTSSSLTSIVSTSLRTRARPICGHPVPGKPVRGVRTSDIHKPQQGHPGELFEKRDELGYAPVPCREQCVSPYLNSEGVEIAACQYWAFATLCCKPTQGLSELCLMQLLRRDPQVRVCVRAPMWRAHLRQAGRRSRVTYSSAHRRGIRAPRDSGALCTCLPNTQLCCSQASASRMIRKPARVVGRTTANQTRGTMPSRGQVFFNPSCRGGSHTGSTT